MNKVLRCRRGTARRSVPQPTCCKRKGAVSAANWQYFRRSTCHYGHYTGQPVLAGTPVKNWRILLEKRFAARMPLLTATSAFEWERRRYTAVLSGITCTVSEPYRCSTAEKHKNRLNFRVWDNVSEGSTLIFGDTRVVLEHSIGS